MIDKNAIPPIGVDSPWLAPLAGFSDLPFRLLCQELGAKVTCTEMISAKGLVYGLQQRCNRGIVPCLEASTDAGQDIRSSLYGDLLVPSTNATEDLLNTVKAEENLVLQLFGAEEDFLGSAVEYLKGLGFHWFDLNMGCSVPKVTKTGAGAAMLKDLQNAAECVKKMHKAGGVIGCKIRLGWNMGEYVYEDFAACLEDAGAAWITLHPRFARQAFTGEVEKKALEKLARKVNVPIIASGDLFCAQDGIDRIKNYGASGVMFARGAMENPFIFQQYHSLIQGKEVQLPDANALCQLVLRHALLAKAYTPGKVGRKGFAPALLKMRTVVPRYLKNLQNIKKLRQSLGQCASWEEFHVIISDFFGTLALRIN